MNQNLTFVTFAVQGRHILNMFCVDPYVPTIPNWFEILHDTQVQHNLNIFHWYF